MDFEFKLPDIGEGIVEGEIVQWLVREGDTVEEDQPLVEVLTDKATVEIPSPLKGKITRLNWKNGATVEVGATLLVIQPEEGQRISPRLDTTGSHSQPPSVTKPSIKVREGATRTLATPSIRRQASRLGIDLTQLTGTGRGGRITEEDLDTFRAASQSEGHSSSTTSPLGQIPYRGIRRKIGQRMTRAKTTAPHFTYVEEVDATELVKLRARVLERRVAGPRITYLPFLIKAIIQGLQAYPMLNARLDEEAGHIELRTEYNIGIAAHTPEGLMVPVVKEADQKGLVELSEEIQRLSSAASEGRLQLADLQNGTFTITSLGALGGLVATPIINFPEVAILAIHKIAPRPVVRQDQIVIRQMMNLSLSLDHRVVDGAEAAHFLHHIIPLIEDPSWLAEEADKF